MAVVLMKKVTAQVTGGDEEVVIGAGNHVHNGVAEAQNVILPI